MLLPPYAMPAIIISPDAIRRHAYFVFLLLRCLR